MSVHDTTMMMEPARKAAEIYGNDIIRHGNMNRLFDLMSEGAYCVDRDRRIVQWNNAAEKITGYTANDVLGAYCFENLLQHVDADGYQLCTGCDFCPLYGTMKDGQARTDHASLLHKEGNRIPVWIKTMPLRDESGDVVGAVELFDEQGKADRLRQQLATVSRVAYMDSLTGLPNRRFLDVRFSQCLEEWERYGWSFACFISDIDHFKNINDTYGHDGGDQAIFVVFNALAKACRGLDIVGRWGGDEAMGILKNVDEDQLRTVVARMNDLVRRSKIGQAAQCFNATVSIGATIAKSGDCLKSIMKRADCGLYYSKKNGRDRGTIVR